MAAEKTEPAKFSALLSRHGAALGYIFRVVLPVIFRTRRRPVVFSRRTGMGDIICTIPAARELMKRHPGATFIYNCHPDFAAVPRLAGVADRVTTHADVGGLSRWDKIFLGGFYHFAHGDDVPGQAAQEPMVAEFCRQFGVTVTDEHPQFLAPDAAREKVAALLAKKNLAADNLILIHPGPSWTVKEWPREHWAKLVSELRAHGFGNIAQVGSARYLGLAQVKLTEVPGVVSLVDELSIEECVAAFARAKLFVGMDSGLLHLAAATRTPSVGVWGPTDPRLFYAEKFRAGFLTARVDCAGCEHEKPRRHWFTNCPHDMKCMKAIAPAEVLSACLNFLAQK